MIDDIRTLIWKESKEVMRQGSSKTGNVGRLLFIAAFFGIFNPYVVGERYLTGVGPFAGLFAILLIVTITVTVEAFAGERERHTLETLLSTRLSDDAILFGKLTASIVYSCAGMIIIPLLALLTINVSHRHSGTIFLFSVEQTVTLLVTIVLSSTLMSTLAVLISLRAATVRQASQVLAFGMVIPIMTAVITFNRMPAEWRTRLVVMLSPANLPQTEITVLLLTVAVIALLLFIARSRFRRAILILD